MIGLEQDGPVARLVIDRPAKRNAMTTAMFAAIPGLLDQAIAAGARVLVLSSATPGLFCAGADIGELSSRADDAAWRAENQGAIDAAQHALAGVPIPAIAFVDGDCVGGGCGLALACDLRVATPRARFGITPAKLGLVYPLHDTRLLVDLVGPGQAKRLLFTGALLDTAEAQRIGLVEVAADSLDALVAAIVAQSGYSQRTTKAIVARIVSGQADDDAATRAMFAQAFTAVDFREGVDAFLAKRPPVFG